MDKAWIPMFRETCYPYSALNATEQQAEGAAASPDDSIADESSVEPTSWEQHLADAPSSSFMSSFQDLLTSNRKSSLIFFGEQHHQPAVIRAQIQMLAALVEQRRKHESDTPADSTKPAKPVKYHLHLLMEHFSIADQPLLDRYRLGHLSISELCAAYRHRSNEGFRLEMYAPLLLLARESQVNLWGGFPQKSWARVAMREGIASVEHLEEQRMQEPYRDPVRAESTKDGQSAPSGPSEDLPVSAVPAPPPLPPLSETERLIIPQFTSWHNVSTLTASHRVFLSSLMKPDKPPLFTKLAMQAYPATETVVTTRLRYPTEQIPYPAPQLLGFGPAQALKDSYLAHAARCLLKDGHTLASTPSQPLSSPRAVTGEPAEVEHRNIVMVVAGLGHIQAGFGGPERVSTNNSRADQDTSKDDYNNLIVLSVPRDSSLWLGPEWEQPSVETDGPSKGASGLPHDQGDREPAQKPLESTETSPSGAKISEGWDRKLADAIVLYDWVDFDAESQEQGSTTS